MIVLWLQRENDGLVLSLSPAMRRLPVEQLHVVVRGGSRVLLLLHGDPGDGGGGEVVVAQGQVEELAGEVGAGADGADLGEREML